MYDIIIKNGNILNGEGTDAFISDIAIKDGKIACISQNLDGASKTIDASGLTVTPGFIDSHSHSDNAVLDFPWVIEKCEQGITTSIAGQCGSSVAPRPDLNNDKICTVEAFFKAVDKTPQGSNIAMLVGHGTLRKTVMGTANRKPTEAELEKMKELLREGMKAGALGISFGLIYVPGTYAETEELCALAKVAAEYEGLVAAHIRNESDNLIEATEEFINIIEYSGARGVLSHHKSAMKRNHGKVKTTLKMIDEANARGLDIYCDVYPYTASSTSLSVRFVPKEYCADGKIVENLKKTEIRAEIIKSIKESENEGLDWLLVNNCPSVPKYQGMRISEIAKMLGKTPADTYVDVLIESGGSCSASSFTMCEDDVMTVIKHPRAMVCTDSSVAKNSKVYHPRLRGTFPRAIRKYAREEKILSLAELIRKMTSLPAHVYGLKTKGLIAEGYDADLCIFDFDKITDKADYTNCEARAEGLCYVICGGEIIAENAICTGKTPGKLLRRKH